MGTGSAVPCSAVPFAAPHKSDSEPTTKGPFAGVHDSGLARSGISGQPRRPPICGRFSQKTAIIAEFLISQRPRCPTHVNRFALLEQPPSVVRFYDHISIGCSSSHRRDLITRFLPRQEEVRSCLCAARSKLVKYDVHHVVTGLNIPHNVLLPRDAPLQYCVFSDTFPRDL
jgi:hypothetical protein